MSTASLPRDERRRKSEAAILEAARELFSEVGFERATIRAVAAKAGIDPALVMQHFGNKEQLFAAAARWTTKHDGVRTADREALPQAALADLFQVFEGDPSHREGAAALLRNCLTHPSAATIMRDEVMCERAAEVAATIGGEDAELRAALMGACMVGLSISRYLLEIEPVASASREELERVMGPVLRALLEPADETG
jgi:AcrR family transcriptional regulator